MLVFFLVVLVLVDVRAGPGVNAAAIGFGNLRIIPWLCLQLDVAVLRNIEFELLIQHGAALGEIVLHPKLARSQSGVGDSYEVIFEFFSRTQAGDRDVFLAIVGINRRFLLEGDAQILD